MPNVAVSSTRAICVFHSIQAGGGQYVELKDGMIRRLAQATGRTVVYNSLSQTMRKPDGCG